MALTTITISGERLATMYDLDYSLWVTPGEEDNPYWASHASWQNDYSIGGAADVLDAWNDQVGDCLGIEDIRDEDSVLVIEIETAFVPEEPEEE